MHSSGLCSLRKPKRKDSGDSETVEEREVGGTHNTQDHQQGPCMESGRARAGQKRAGERTLGRSCGLGITLSGLPENQQ